MPVDRTSAARRAKLRGRVAACLRSEAGDTIIEVTIAALLVALIAAATFAGYTGVAHVAAGQKARAQASALAESDQARLKGLTLSSLSSAGSGVAFGNTTYNSTVDGTTYTVTSSAQFISSTTGTPACTSSTLNNADQVQTTSTITWNSDALVGGPVQIHGLVTPRVGGALIVRVLDSLGHDVVGASVALSGGPTSPAPLTTDANGCVEFAELTGGTYTASTTISGSAASATAPAVVPTQTSQVTISPSGGNGGISATFHTTYNGSSHSSTADQVTAWNSLYPSVYHVFGTASTLGSNTYTGTVTSGTNLTPGSYVAYAGSCGGDYASGGSQSASVTSSTTQGVNLALPAMIVNVYGNSGTNTEVDDAVSSSVTYSGGGWTHGLTGNQNYNSTESFSLTTGDYVQFTFTGTAVKWIAPESNNGGYADIYIDGTKVASNITTYNASTSYQQVIWSTTGLSSGSHTLKIIADGTKPAASTATYVQIDAFIYTTPSLITLAPVVTLTDNNTGCSGENYPATQVPTATQGALADPGQPYGNFTVCASSGGFKNTATVANTSYTAGNPVNIYLGTGSSGLTSGSCT